METNKTQLDNTKAPFFPYRFKVLKRDPLPFYKKLIINISIPLLAFIISILFARIFIQDNFFNLIKTLFTGAVEMPWTLFKDTALLLGFGIAILPAFKMKYWNMGAGGSVMMGCLLSCVMMFYLGKSGIPNGILIILMLIVSILTSIIWSVIPAIFKSYFNTNETLFTLMMNYVAIGIVGYVNFIMANGRKESPGVINATTKLGWLPNVFNTDAFIPIIVISLLTVFIYIYNTKTKHGFEISVLGDSSNTAKYAGMKVEKITIRTLILCGAICGIIGFLYASQINHSVSTTTGGNLGFTGILVAWLSNFNPLIMLGFSFLLAFITNGTNKISSFYRLGSNNLSNIIFGLIFSSILISEFFIRYKIKVIKLKESDGK